jgi:hypothetical protein
MPNSAILPKRMRHPRSPLLLIVFVAVVSFVVHLSSHGSLYGGGDEGSYIATGKLMSQSLRFVYPDEAAEFGRRYLPLSSFVPSGFSSYNDEVHPPEVVSGWNKGFAIFSIPMWLLFPERGWMGVSPLACAISIVAIYFVGAAIRSPFVGVGAALLLATNWLQLWFSRYPMSEVLSQSMILLMLLCVVSFIQTSRRIFVFIFTLLASFASVVHFANVPIWGMLGVTMLAPLLPMRRREDVNPTLSWIFQPASFRIERSKILPFVGTAVLTLGVPLLTTVSYWLADPGVRRYVRFSQKMVSTSGRLDQLAESLVVRLQNLSLFVPSFVWLVLLVCVALFITNRGAPRRWLLLLGSLALLSFLLIVTSGVGTPRVLYVARRNVPVIIPALCLLTAVAIDYAASLIRRPVLSKSFAAMLVLGLSVMQLYTFYPFRKVDQARGSLSLAADVKAAMSERNTGRPQFLLVTDFGANLKTGLRYVSNIPILNFSPAITPDVISRMLGDGVDLYVLDDIYRPIAKLITTMPNARLSQIATHTVWMGHPNQVGPTDFPKISNGPNLNFYLYKIETQ